MRRPAIAEVTRMASAGDGDVAAARHQFVMQKWTAAALSQRLQVGISLAFVALDTAPRSTVELDPPRRPCNR